MFSLRAREERRGAKRHELQKEKSEQEMWNTVLAEHLSSYEMMCLPVRLTHINSPLTSRRDTVGERERGRVRRGYHKSIVCHHHGDL